jgi:hypothetical protein
MSLPAWSFDFATEPNTNASSIRGSNGASASPIGSAIPKDLTHSPRNSASRGQEVFKRILRWLPTRSSSANPPATSLSTMTADWDLLAPPMRINSFSA